MSHRRDVMLAIKALIVAALPQARVGGFELDGEKPERADPGGDVFGHPGQMELIGTELSPVAYTYRHTLPIEVSAPLGSTVQDEIIDTMMGDIGAAVKAETIGGLLGCLVDWLECVPAEFEDENLAGARAVRWGGFAIVATYTVADPLN